MSNRERIVAELREQASSQEFLNSNDPGKLLRQAADYIESLPAIKTGVNPYDVVDFVVQNVHPDMDYDCLPQLLSIAQKANKSRSNREKAIADLCAAAKDVYSDLTNVIANSGPNPKFIAVNADNGKRLIDAITLVEEMLS